MSDSPVQDMTTDECWTRLAGAGFGRLATAAAGEVTITPVNLAVHDGRVVFRTAPGTKLADIVVADAVAVEADEITGDAAWSVVARGTARIVEGSAEREELDALQLRPWVDTEKDVYVVVDVDQVTGRHFTLTR